MPTIKLQLVNNYKFGVDLNKISFSIVNQKMQ